MITQALTMITSCFVYAINLAYEERMLEFVFHRYSGGLNPGKDSLLTLILLRFVIMVDINFSRGKSLQKLESFGIISLTNFNAQFFLH